MLVECHNNTNHPITMPHLHQLPSHHPIKIQQIHTAQASSNKRMIPDLIFRLLKITHWFGTFLSLCFLSASKVVVTNFIKYATGTCTSTHKGVYKPACNFLESTVVSGITLLLD